MRFGCSSRSLAGPLTWVIHGSGRVAGKGEHHAVSQQRATGRARCQGRKQGIALRIETRMPCARIGKRMVRFRLSERETLAGVRQIGSNPLSERPRRPSGVRGAARRRRGARLHGRDAAAEEGRDQCDDREHRQRRSQAVDARGGRSRARRHRPSWRGRRLRRARSAVDRPRRRRRCPQASLWPGI